MRVSPARGALIRELLVNGLVLGLGIWAASAIALKFVLIGSTLERVPVLPTFFAPLGSFAFFLLAAVMGFAFAQGSAVHRNSANYKLGQVYDRLASTALEQFAARLPPETIAFLSRVADYLDRNQRAHATSAEARRAIVNVADELRRLARDLEVTQPSIAARYSDMASYVFATIHTRQLRVEVTNHETESALRAGSRYTIRLKFAAGVLAQNGLPADFGSQSALHLTLNLFGENLLVAERALRVTLPQWGESTEATTSMEVLEVGPCRLRVVVTTAAELEILQVYTYAFAGTAGECLAG